jgi:transcriptional regulator with XRE-family HTH domain
MNIGEKIRSHRKEKRMTLQELSRKSGVALATLSRMETGKMSGTLRSHTNICKSLGISIAELYREIEDSSKNVETITDEKKPERMESSGKIRYELLIARTNDKKMLPVIIKLTPGSKTQYERNQTGCEKFLYALRGAAEVDISGKSYGLKKGDSLYFDSSLKHRLENRTSSPAEIMSVTSSAQK